MIRPLDRLGSIKTKLGVLVAVTVAVAASASVLGLQLGLLPRYTVPAAVVVALMTPAIFLKVFTL